MEEKVSSNLPPLMPNSALDGSSILHASPVLSPPTANSWNATSVFDASQYYDDMLGMDELYHNLDLLEHALEQKHSGYQQLVQTLQNESDQAMDSLEHWEQFYATKMEELEAQSTQAEQRLVARERAFQTQLVQLQSEASHKEKTALEKIQWLAEQLQKTKFDAHRQHLQDEQAAWAKQRDLQVKLEDLQSKLHRQFQHRESQVAEHGELQNERLELEREVTTVQLELQQSVRELKALTQNQNRRRDEEQVKHHNQLVQQEVDLQKELKKLRDQFAAETAALRGQLQSRSAQHDEVAQKMRQDFRSRESHLEHALASVTEELQKLKLEAHTKLLAEKDAFRQREETLRAKIAHQQLEIRKHVEAATAQSTQTTTLFQKRLELEQEVAALRQKYVASVSEWEARFRLESESRTRELRAQDSLFSQKIASAQARFEGANQEAESYKTLLKEKIHEQQVEHRSAIEKLQSSFAAKMKEMSARLRGKEDESKRSASTMQKVLMAQKEAFNTDQAKIYALLRQKENDLEEQKKLACSARDEATSFWTKRMELEHELATLRKSYEETVRSWKSKLDAMNDVRKKELDAALQLLSQRETEMGETIRSTAEKAKASELAWEGRLKAKNDQFRQWIQEIRQISEGEKLELQKSLKSIENELQRYKIELHQKLATETTSFQSKLQEMKATVSMADDALRKQLTLSRSLKAASEATRKEKENLETELSELKKELESSLAEREQQVHALQKDFAAKEEEIKERLTKSESQAQAQIESIRHEAESRLAEFKLKSEAEKAQLRSELQHLTGQARAKEKDLRESVASVAAKLERFKLDAHRQMQLAKDDADMVRKELLGAIEAKEKQYDEQVRLTESSQANEKAEAERAKKLEQSLWSLKDRMAQQVSELESRYNSLLESKAVSLQEAELVYAKKVEESRVLVEKLKIAAQAAESEHNDMLKAKDEDYQSKIQALRSSYETQINDTKVQLQAVCESYQQFKFEAHQSLCALKEESHTRHRDLLSQIGVKEEELSNQITVTRQLQEKAEELTLRATELETELQSLKQSQQTEKAAWAAQCQELRNTHDEERRKLSQLIENTNSEAIRRLDAVLNEKQQQALEFQSNIQAQSDRHAEDVQELGRLSQAKESDLRQKILELGQLKDIAESDAREWKSAEAGAVAKRKELEDELNRSHREIAETVKRLAEERAKTEELSATCSTLQMELSTVRSQYDVAISEWKNRCEALSSSLDNEKRSASDQTARVSLEAQERAVKEVDLMQSIRDLQREIRHKEDTFSNELKTLQEASMRRESDLQLRLADVNDQLEKQRLTEQQREVEQEAERSNGVSNDAHRLAEKVRYDLTKQIVKRNVEILRQKAELKEKEAQIAALKSGLDVDSTARTRLNLAAVKDRVAKILRGETERAVMPYTFQHSNMLP